MKLEAMQRKDLRFIYKHNRTLSVSSPTDWNFYALIDGGFKSDHTNYLKR